MTPFTSQPSWSAVIVGDPRFGDDGLPRPDGAGGGLRSWTRPLALPLPGDSADRSAAGSATEQVRLYGGVLSPLPGTRHEAEAVARIVKSAGATAAVLVGADAMLSTIRALVDERAPRVLHLATHGLTGSRERPYDASLAFTPPARPTPDDIGFLTLDELMSAWLGRLTACDLVVLSGCDTGEGVQQGDNIMALPIGFFAAGAPTVIASLWQVNDVSTSMLMEDFYRNVFLKKMSKTQALFEARRALREMTWDDLQRRCRMTPEAFDAYAASRGLGQSVVAPKGHLQPPFAHPHYWAPFILLGDPD